MKKKGVTEWVEQPLIRQILLAFLSPKTPRKVEQIVGIKKLKLKPFLDNMLLKVLNPKAQKGRLYTLTNKARELLDLPATRNNSRIDWDLKGWVIASPQQRLVLLQVTDLIKRTSEQIRYQANKLNPNLTRISTINTLKELVKKGLISTSKTNRTRLFWISNQGALLNDDLRRFPIN